MRGEDLSIDLTSKVTRNSLYNLFGQSAMLLVGFLAARVLFRGLGEDAFGLILFATTLNAVLSNLLDLGLMATTVRAIAVHRRDARYLSAYVRTVTTLYWSTYAVLVCGAYLAAPIIVTHWIHLSTLPPETARVALWLLLTGAFSSVLRNLYSGIFRGLQRMEFNNLIDVGMNVLQQAGAIVLLLLGEGLMAVAVWMLFTYLLAVLTYVLCLTRFFPLPAFVPGYEPAIVRDQWRYTASIAGSTVLSTAFVQSDKLVVSKLLPLSAFGYYAFAWASVWRVAALGTVVSQAAFPSLAALLQAGAVERAVRQFRNLQDIVCYATAVPVAALAFGSLPLFRYLFGLHVAESLLLPVLLLSIASYMQATLIMVITVAGAGGRPDLLTRLNLIAVFTFLPALVLLVAMFGLTGAGLAWIAYYGLAYSYLVPRVCRHCLGVSAGSWYRQVGQALAVGTVTYGAGWVVCYALFRTEPSYWVLSFVLATAAFALLAAVTVGRSLATSLLRLTGAAPAA